MLQQKGLDALFTMIFEAYDGVPQVPNVVKVFTQNVLTDSCLVTEFLKNVAQPISCVRGKAYYKIAAFTLYRVYKIFFCTQAATAEDSVKLEGIKSFKRILELNGFIVKRVKSRRGEIQGIKLDTTRLEDIFKAAGKENEYEVWFTSTIGMSTERYNDLLNQDHQQGVLNMEEKKMKFEERT